ncbi:stromal interaction molecule [Holotrichia oblita]|uniref:Stromal interaction molecule n=1 Tax=Holotrichia oblita TaxID=644536 RepID=A0ACB9TAV0_HOLOL|nr:stromal interaction molecule [Holotrichia oblita]
MYFQNVVFWLVFLLYWCDGTCSEAQFNYDDSKYNTGSRENMRSTYSVLSDTIAQAVKEKPQDTCNSEDYSCLAMLSSDKHGLEAIRELHKQLDDDENGNVDLSETGDFLRQDLKIDSGYEKRQQVFHQNDDMHISVRELWEAWLRSEVHNWTIEQTVEWLTT